MTHNYPLLYEVKPKESFEAEGRLFKKDILYPVYNRNGNSFLCAENGDFYFTNKLMQEAIKKWQLEVIYS